MSEVIELPASSNSALSLVTRQDLASMKDQREILKEFIKSQLREANFSSPDSKDYGEGDYGIIPGTKKKSLLKPGAEKILRLFGLGARVRLVDKEIDRKTNFAIFTYRCEVYHLKSGIVIAECEGSVNSQEKKYRERTVWKKIKGGGSASHVEETPICDILNTLMKMAQKRALIGATLLATAASDYFTQDMEFDEDPETTKQQALSQQKPQAKEETKSEQPPRSTEKGPLCCGKPMMVSKWPKNDGKNWYCLGCKTKKPRDV